MIDLYSTGKSTVQIGVLLAISESTSRRILIPRRFSDFGDVTRIPVKAGDVCTGKTIEEISETFNVTCDEIYNILKTEKVLQ